MSSGSQTPKNTSAQKDAKASASLKTSLAQIVKPTVAGRSAPLGTIIIEKKKMA